MRLLADLGGTNARFALCSGPGQVSDLAVLPVAEHAAFGDALRGFLSGVETSGLLDAVLAVAGPVDGQHVRMTNTGWEVSAAAVQAVIPGAPVRLLNDLAAVAHALPMLGAADVSPVRAAEMAPQDAPRLVINLGTGFGAAVAIPGGTVLATEAGHMSLAPRDAEDARLIGPATTVEEVLSGPGIAALRDRLGDTPETTGLLSRLLGRISGDLVLATGCWGGLYFCGGVLQDFRAIISPKAFLDGFETRTGVGARLREVDVFSITHPQPAMLGMSGL